MEHIIKRERIRDDARHAVATNRRADTCPEEFHPYQDVWFDEYRMAIDEARERNRMAQDRVTRLPNAELSAG